MAIYPTIKTNDKWILKRDKFGVCQDISCNGHSILVNKLNIKYPVNSLPVLHLDIVLGSFDIENIA